MTAVVLRGDARDLPLPDESVDLIVTSPPYWSLRSYTDAGEHYAGQIGSEATPQEWVAAMLDCTREWMRVLKPTGSLFVNLGDKYSDRADGGPSAARSGRGDHADCCAPSPNTTSIAPRKSLLGMPWRYALGCIDDLGLILRRDNIWHKVNPLPESVDDRCATRHEYLFHFVKEARYFAAIDEIREPHTGGTHGRRADGKMSPKESATVVAGHRNGYFPDDTENPLGKLPGSVWEIPSQPLSVPAHLAVDHFAAFPMELPRRCILGWSPSGICTMCGDARRPVAVREQQWTGRVNSGRAKRQLTDCIGMSRGHNAAGYPHTVSQTTITGYACACTPYTDHGAQDVSTTRRERSAPGTRAQGTYGRHQAGEYERVGPWREYHVAGWKPPPVRPAVVADPFGGTGTTALVADVLGRTGISFDRSADYCRLARWRTTDPSERAKAMQVPKPPPVPDGQESLFDLEAS